MALRNSSCPASGRRRRGTCTRAACTFAPARRVFAYSIGMRRERARRPGCSLRRVGCVIGVHERGSEVAVAEPLLNGGHGGAGCSHRGSEGVAQVALGAAEYAEALAEHLCILRESFVAH